MMFSFPAIAQLDFDALTCGKGPQGTRHAGGQESLGKAGLFEMDADAGAAFARLLEGAFACEDGDTEALSRIVPTGHEAGLDPEDQWKLLQILEFLGHLHIDGPSDGNAAASNAGVFFKGDAAMPGDPSEVSERLARVLAGLAAGSMGAGKADMRESTGEPSVDQFQRNMASKSNTGAAAFSSDAETPKGLSEVSARLGRILAGLAAGSMETGGAGTKSSSGESHADRFHRILASEDTRAHGSRAEGADAALARIVSAFSRNSAETQSVERHTAQAAETLDPTGKGRAGDGSDKAGVGSGKESPKMRAYLDALAEQLTGETKKEASGRMGLKMTGFREGAAKAAHLSGEPARAQGSSGTQVHGAAASTTGSISMPGGAMGAETSAFGGDGGFQGAMAESSGGKAAPAATDAGNPGPSPAAAFDKHLQSPAQLLENRVVGQVFMRLFTGAGRGSSSMTVNIHPPELGSVRVRIVSEHGRMSVQLNAQTQQVAGILERNLPALHQSLADQGIDIDDLHVGVDSGENENGGFEERAFMDRPSGKPLHAAGEDAGQASREPAPEPGYTEGRGLSLRV